MANMCKCKLTLHGSPDNLMKLVEDVLSKDSGGRIAWQFSKVSNEKLFGFYSWSIILDPQWKNGPHCLEAGFETKWAPPLEWFEIIRTKYDVYGTLNYFNRGSKHCGELAIHSDETVTELELDSPLTHWWTKYEGWLGG